MKGFLALLALASTVAASKYYKIKAWSPGQPDVHGKIINARDRAFVIGAPKPRTYCGLDDKVQCPAGEATLIDDEMTLLASAAPGGQFIFVGPDGDVAYPAAHSSLRPPGSQMGGFKKSQVQSPCGATVTVLTWQSNDGGVGFWACESSPGVPLGQEAILKAQTSQFSNQGCLNVDGVQLDEGGDTFGAWAYS